MTRVNVLAKFKTTIGLILVVTTNEPVKVGEVVCCENQQYIIKSIMLATRPTDSLDNISIVVEPI